MRRRASEIGVLLALMTLLVMPVAALAVEEEPYSGGEVTETTLAPRIIVAAEGLTVSFRAAGVTGTCMWDFGDDQTGEGNPAEHTYAEDGTYDVSATCGDVALDRSVAFAAELSFTGFDVGPAAFVGVILLLTGSAIVLLVRRIRADH